MLLTKRRRSGCLATTLAAAKRRRRFLILALAGLLYILYLVTKLRPAWNDVVRKPTMDPPTWDALREWEENLPQHNPDLPLPEGRHGRYVYFSNQIQGLGWNNQLNEMYVPSFLLELILTGACT